MKLLYSFAQFIMSEWVWLFTFALYHPLVTIIVMIPMLMYYARQTLIGSVLYAVFSQVYAIIVFSLFTHLMLNRIFDIPFPDYDSHMIHPFWACFLLAAIFTCFQLSFFRLLRSWYSFSIESFAVAVIVANLVSALIIFKFLPTL